MGEGVVMHSDNIKIAKWLGWTDIHISQQDGNMYAKMDPSDSNRYLVNGEFKLLDSHAIAILPMLIQKCFYWELFSSESIKGRGFGISIANPDTRDFDFDITEDANVTTCFSKTIAGAITSAVLDIINKENQ
jgi:hypothetical protein